MEIYNSRNGELVLQPDGNATAAYDAIQAAQDAGSATVQLSGCEDLKEVPAVLKVLRDTLEDLRIDNNFELRTLPPMLGDFPRLRRVDASYCRLESVSPALCCLTRLSQLYLSNNQLSFLPPEMGKLKKLEELRIDNNRLQLLPGGLLFLPQLRDVSLENNPLYSAAEVAGAEAALLVPPQSSVDCASCCARVDAYQVRVSFHRLPSCDGRELPFVFFTCSPTCLGHLSRRLENYDAGKSV